MFVRPISWSSSQALSSLIRVPASSQTSLRPATPDRTKSGSGAGTRAMASGRSRKPRAEVLDRFTRADCPHVDGYQPQRSA